MMGRKPLLVVIGAFAVLGLLIGATLGEAHPWRPEQIPNGQAFQCLNCHMSALGGDARNPFGRDVEARVSPGSMQEFWSAELAALDSDGDGASNGVELGDPDGSWRPGQPNPQVAMVFNPGDPNSTPPLQTEAVTYTAILLGANEVPPVTTQAHGWMLARLSADQTTLDYWLHVFDIDNVTNSHIHIGAAGVNGPVVYPLAIPSAGPTSGSIDGITAEDIENLENGNYYVNVHTSQNPGGEIRGQLEVIPLRFTATLDGAQEVPPVQTAASGEGTVELSADLSTISWELSVSGLEQINAAHFHNAPAGANAGVILGIASEHFTETSGEAELTEAFLVHLLNKEIYINVHTPEHGGGEIRGQVYWDIDLNLPPLSNVEAWEALR